MKAKMYSLLDQAQKLYGKADQLTVATEELCELAAVLCKYPRYPDEATAEQELRAKVVGELADVVICLGHVQMIFGLSDTDIAAAVDSKLERLERWLNSEDKTQYVTMKDREVREI